MLKTCLAASALAVVALAMPVHAETQFEHDLKACTEIGEGPGSGHETACILQRKIDRYQQTRKRAADLGAMPPGSPRVSSDVYYVPHTNKPVAKNGPLPDDLAVLSPMPRPATVPSPQVTLSVTTTKVCVTEGDAVTTQAQGNGANPDVNCQTNTEVTKHVVQAPPQPDTSTDPGDAIDGPTHF